MSFNLGLNIYIHSIREWILRGVIIILPSNDTKRVVWIGGLLFSCFCSCFNGLEYREVIERKNVQSFPLRKRSSLKKKQQLALPSKKCRTNTWRVQDWPTKQICIEKVVCIYIYMNILWKLTATCFPGFKHFRVYFETTHFRAKMCIFEFCRWKVGVDLTLSMWWFNSWPFLSPIVGGHKQPLSSGHVFSIPKRSQSQNCRWTTFWCPWRFWSFQRLLATSK